MPLSIMPTEEVLEKHYYNTCSQQSEMLYIYDHDHQKKMQHNYNNLQI